MKLFWSALAIISTACLLVVLYLVIKQSDLLYHPDFPSPTLEETPQESGLEYSDIILVTSDDIELHGWFIPARNAMITILFCHGNAGNISHRLDSIRLFHELNLNVLIFDYRGYGQSQGSPDEEGTYRDARAAWDYLVERQDGASQQIVVFGVSLGAAVASRLAGEVDPGAVILQSPFVSIPEMVGTFVPFLPIGWLSRFAYNNVEHVRRIQSPLLIIHSREDELIPFAHGERVFAAANDPKTFLEIHGSHNGGFIQSRSIYTQAVRSFLAQHLPDYNGNR